MDAALSKLAKKDVPYAKMIPVQKDSDKSEFVEAQDERWVTPRKWPRCSRAGSTPTGVRLRLASPRRWLACAPVRRPRFPFVRASPLAEDAARKPSPCLREFLVAEFTHLAPDGRGALGCIDLVPARLLRRLNSKIVHRMAYQMCSVDGRSHISPRRQGR